MSTLYGDKKVHFRATRGDVSYSGSVMVRSKTEALAAISKMHGIKWQEYSTFVAWEDADGPSNPFCMLPRPGGITAAPLPPPSNEGAVVLKARSFFKIKEA